MCILRTRSALRSDSIYGSEMKHRGEGIISVRMRNFARILAFRRCGTIIFVRTAFV